MNEKTFGLHIILYLLFTLSSLDPNSNVAPPDTPSTAAGGYTITAARLAELRSNFMYWFFDRDQYGGNGDYQKDIHASMTQLHKNLNFQMPFYGFRFNYTRVSTVYILYIYIYIYLYISLLSIAVVEWLSGVLRPTRVSHIPPSVPHQGLADQA